MASKKIKRTSADTVQPAWQDRLCYFEERRADMVLTIREMVEIESPSDDKAACDRMGEVLAERFATLGGTVRFHRAEEFGNNLQIDFPGREKIKPVLLLG